MNGFEHVFIPPSVSGLPTILALHGTGGNEHDLVPLAKKLLPGAGILSPRGRVLEGTMPRFFRRLSEGVFDLDDLKFRTGELGDFIAEASKQYSFDSQRVVAVGFSNGANIGGSLLLLKPGVLRGAVLLRAMVPIVPEPLPQLAGTRVLISNGERDPLVSLAETDRLTALLRNAGATVDLAMQPTAHNLIAQDVEIAGRWLRDLGL